MNPKLPSSVSGRAFAPSTGLFALAVLVLAAGVWAQGPPGQSPAAERAQYFQRNQALIKALVRGGLRLAEEPDPLQRADHCNAVVELFAVEMRLAADNRDGGRVAELGQHLRALLEGGVAINLSTARGNIPQGSAREKHLRAVRDRSEQLTSPLEAQLRLVENNDDVEQAFLAVARGRDKVKQAIQLPKNDAPKE